MTIIEQFENFAEDFETAVNDDDWVRLRKYFREDATCLTVGEPNPNCEGRDAIFD